MNYYIIPPVTHHFDPSEGKMADQQNHLALIDEHHIPTVSSFTYQSKLNIARSTLHEFYNALKSCDNLIQMIFNIRNCKIFGKLSIFSAINILDGISF